MASPDAHAADAAWLPGATPRGPAGMHRVMYGHASAPSGLSFSLFADVAATHGLLFDGDAAVQTEQSLAVLWTLNRHVEVGIYGLSNVFTDSVFADDAAFDLLPGVVAKWNIGTWDGFAAGLFFNWTAPASGTGHEVLSPYNAIYTFSALGSRSLGPWLELSLNVGYILDRARFAAGQFNNPAQTFAMGLATTDRVSAGVGLASLLPPVWQQIALAPYLEVTSEWAHKTRAQDNPLRLTVGTKAFFDTARTWEAELGVDIRMMGAPRTGSLYAGIMPWNLFATCSWHSTLGALDRAQTRVVYLPSASTPPPPMVVLAGEVHDAGARVLTDVRLVVNGNPNTAVAADPESGRYQTLPIALTEGNVTLEAVAPGYLGQKQCVPAAMAQSGQITLNFHLRRKAVSAYMRLQVYDADKGQPLAQARVFVPSEDVAQATDAQGAVRFAMRPGRYEVLVSAPGYALQRFGVDLPDETEWVLNAGLHALPPMPPPAAP